jgi:hypothetical protein
MPRRSLPSWTIHQEARALRYEFKRETLGLLVKLGLGARRERLSSWSFHGTSSPLTEPGIGRR